MSDDTLPSEASTAPSSSNAQGSLRMRPSLRLMRGSSIADLPVGCYPDPQLADFAGVYEHGEYLSVLIATKASVGKLAEVPSFTGEPEEEVDEGERMLWLYEHLLRLPADLTPLVTSLLEECTSKTCPTMMGGEWQYLCAAHPQGDVRECCAIDYILHTLDSATSRLTSSRAFPSRLSIPPSSASHLRDVARRLARIFSHAYWSHRAVFNECEAETSLYARFVHLVQTHALLSPQDLSIPFPSTSNTSNPSTFSRHLSAEAADHSAPSTTADAPSTADLDDDDDGDWAPRTTTSASGAGFAFSISPSEEDDEEEDLYSPEEEEREGGGEHPHLKRGEPKQPDSDWTPSALGDSKSPPPEEKEESPATPADDPTTSPPPPPPPAPSAAAAARKSTTALHTPVSGGGGARGGYDMKSMGRSGSRRMLREFELAKTAQGPDADD